jgi:hypothetical protein
VRGNKKVKKKEKKMNLRKLTIELDNVTKVFNSGDVLNGRVIVELGAPLNVTGITHYQRRFSFVEA